MSNTITYNVCRNNLGDDTTDAQYTAYKALVAAALAKAFPAAEIDVGDSSFCNASTCSSSDFDITDGDIEEVVCNVGDSWWGDESTAESAA